MVEKLTNEELLAYAAALEAKIASLNAKQMAVKIL